MSRDQQGAAVGLLLSAAILYFDYMTPLGVADANLYVAVVVIGLLFRSKRLVLVFGGLGIALTVVGIFLSPSGAALSVFLLNRGLAVFAIVVLTASGYAFLTRQLQLESKLREIAETDELTGVASRRLLIKQLEDNVSKAQRYGSSLAIMVLDIDQFKQINDRYGHVCGDEILARVAQVCFSCARKVDVVGRYGGDEFIVICPNANDEGVHALAERMRLAVREIKIACLPPECEVKISIGMARLDKDVNSAMELLKRADGALLEAKHRGKDQVIVNWG